MTDPPPSPGRRGWALLGEGDTRAALRVFAIEALRSMDDVEYTVGYGLATAVLGKHETAVWAMRRAATLDAAAPHGLAVEKGVTPLVHALLEHYVGRSETGRDTDRLFMIAVLHYLLAEDGRARLAVTAALALDDDPAADSLGRFLGVRTRD